MSVPSTRLAHVAVMVQDRANAEKVNTLLSACGEYVVGRMGLPYPPKNTHIISVVLDAPADVVNSLTGKLGALEGVTAKAMFAKDGGANAAR